jgi:hypothetical protein
VEKLSEKSEKSGEFGKQELTAVREENEIGKARRSEVPQGGTAKFMLYRLRVYTVLAFCFSCGEVHRALNAASLLADRKKKLHGLGLKSSFAWREVRADASKSNAKRAVISRLRSGEGAQTGQARRLSYPKNPALLNFRCVGPGREL